MALCSSLFGSISGRLSPQNSQDGPVNSRLLMYLITPVEREGFSNSSILNPRAYSHSLIFEPITVNQRTEYYD